MPGQIPACPQCHFSQASASQYFGDPAKLEFPLTDLAGVLGFWKKRAVHEALLAMSPAFPQLSFSAVLVESDPRVPLGAHAFCLFNTGGLSAAQDSGALCRLVLLVLDVANTRAACMIGYGLEPFIPQETLDRIAAAALPDLQRRNPAAAIIAALQCARIKFAAAAPPREQAQIESGQKPGAASEGAAYAY